MPRKKGSTAKRRPGRSKTAKAGRPRAKRTTAAAKPASRQAKAHGGTTPGDFRCPDCDFVAKHAMGLGRHRSARHGALSVRAQRESAGGTPKRRGRPPKAAAAASPAGWVTRREAAEIGNVHYNTVRLWERAKLFGTQQRGREVLIDEAAFRKVLAEKKDAPRGRPTGSRTTRAATAPAAGPAAPSFEVTELLARLDALADGLESLARQVRPRKRRGRPPKR